MAVIPHKFQSLLKKKISLKTVGHNHHNHHEYKRLERENCTNGPSIPRGYVPVYVGEYEPMICCKVPTAAFNSRPAFAALLDEYRDEIEECRGPISVPCSFIKFQHALMPCRALFA